MTQFANDMSTGNQDISAVQADIKTLQSLGLPVPSGAQAAITSAQGDISSSVSTANGDIATTNANTSSAYSIAMGMVTGSCSNSGQIAKPQPVATIGS